MPKVEQYEWCRFWWDEADSNAKPRVLLVGDSVTEGYRPFVKELLTGCLVDMLATSKGVDNDAYLHEIDYILGGTPYTYEAVHFNNGLHAMHLDAKTYRTHYETVVAHLLKKSHVGRLILATTTPVTAAGCPKEIDEEKTRIVRERNAAVRKTAERFGLPVDDLFSLVFGKPGYRLNDGLHYNRKGQALQARAVAEILEHSLKG